MLALALVAASCSSGGGGAEAASTVPPTTVGTAPAGATGTTAPAPDDGRPTVILGGDSVMGNLAPGIIAALGDQTDAHYLAQARISGDAAATQAWTQAIEEQDPDLVVIHVGSWEVLSPEFHPGIPGTPDDPYANEVLEPFVDLLTSGGAEVLFIGPAAARSPQRTVNLIAFNRELMSLADRNDAVDFLNAGTYVNDPTGGFTETLPGPDGPVRIRRTDDLGLHLCPAGVVRLGTPVVQWISDHLPTPVTPVPGWDHGDWTRPPLLEKPEQCPAV